jgi:hypothetical protein
VYQGNETPQPAGSAAYRFQSGNIASVGHGRPKGGKAKMAAMFWSDIYAVWQAKGMTVLENLADNDPGTFAKIAAMLVGKAEDIQRDDSRDAAIEAYIEERRQKALKMIERMDGAAASREQVSDAG